MNNIFKALADPTRRKVLQLLKNEDLNVGQIKKHFKITGASLSHHLHILKTSGLVLSEKKGRFVIYSLNTTVFQETLQWLYELNRRLL